MESAPVVSKLLEDGGMDVKMGVSEAVRRGQVSVACSRGGTEELW